MAIIKTLGSAATAVGIGEEMSAQVSLSGALMEMLSTVYKNILLAAIREPIQNAVDASDRVVVHLPTLNNPMVKVVDYGKGMTAEFMTTTYMAFGASTKNASDDSMGGLGVGRWAAYGYIRECFITTCHASDMVSRTYVQYMGADGTPKVKPAVETPGTETGTSVSFPVEIADIQECFNAVAWIKGCMELTMGKSFEVVGGDLPAMFPAQSLIKFDLGLVDDSLDGVFVYPMQSPNLKYGPGGNLVEGSLVVFTNKKSGKGGLPFHVDTISIESPFLKGMVIEIPMSFKVPFMPSREEIKNTKATRELMLRIDAATIKLAEITLTKLKIAKTYESELALETLFGNCDSWHFLGVANAGNESVAGMPFMLKSVMGAIKWRSHVRLNALSVHSPVKIHYRHNYETSKSHVLTKVERGYLALYKGQITGNSIIDFHVKALPKIFVVDAAGGIARVRFWAELNMLDSSMYSQGILTISGGSEACRAEAVDILKSSIDYPFEVIHTSTLPDKPPVLRSSGKGLEVYTGSKIEKESVSFSNFGAGEVAHYLVRSNGSFTGFNGLDARSLGGLLRLQATVSSNLGLNRIFLLSERDYADLMEEVDLAEKEGAFDVDYDGSGTYSIAEAKCLKAWTPVFSTLLSVSKRSEIAAVLNSEIFINESGFYHFESVMHRISNCAPIFELKGSAIEKELAPFVDVINGELNAKRHINNFTQRAYFDFLAGFADFLDPLASSEHKELKELLLSCNNGVYDYHKLHSGLESTYPLFSVLRSNSKKEVLTDLFKSMACLYK